jgi:hypothetical protein
LNPLAGAKTPGVQVGALDVGGGGDAGGEDGDPPPPPQAAASNRPAKRM